MFELHSKFKPSGDQPEAIKKLVEGVNEGKETVSFKVSDAIVQGIFIKYLTTKSDRDLGLERESDY